MKNVFAVHDRLSTENLMDGKVKQYDPTQL